MTTLRNHFMLCSLFPGNRRFSATAVTPFKRNKSSGSINKEEKCVIEEEEEGKLRFVEGLILRNNYLPTQYS